MTDDMVAARIAAALEEYQGALARMPDADRSVLLRFIGVLASFGDDLPDELFDAIEGISVYGVDPGWQLGQLEKILDRWAPRQ